MASPSSAPLTGNSTRRTRLIGLVQRFGFAIDGNQDSAYWAAIAAFCGVAASLVGTLVTVAVAALVGLYTVHVNATQQELGRRQMELGRDQNERFKKQDERLKREEMDRKDDADQREYDRRQEAEDAALTSDLVVYAMNALAQKPSKDARQTLFNHIAKVNKRAADTLTPLFSSDSADGQLLREEAEKITVSSCTDGQAKACFELARDEPDLQKRKGLYAKACAAGSAWACNNLGDMYLHRDQLGEDLARAKEYFKRACDLQLPKGCRNYRALR